MKIPYIPQLLAASLGLLLLSGLPRAYAADSGSLTREYDVFVPPAQDHAFREGMKNWLKCLRDHGSSQTVYAYDAETGNTSEYAFLLPQASWADMGKHTAAGKACRSTFIRSVEPHLAKVHSAIFSGNAKITYDPAKSSPTTPLVWVTDYRIKPGKYKTFMSVAHSITAAAMKTQWSAHYIGYDVLAAGHGSPQILIVQPNDSWAELGKMPSPTMRKMLKSVYGKAASDALLHKLSSTIKEDWSRIWSYDKDLSMTPAPH